jgi:hypothetical protein
LGEFGIAGFAAQLGAAINAECLESCHTALLARYGRIRQWRRAA